EDIGELNPEWNWLAIEYPKNENAKIIHYTLGTPCFKDYKQTDSSEIWHETYHKILEGLE
ncbi:MAG: glycosyltransferase, partial [Nitrosomonadales bacterium]|nr:glycosyltransferase [Nitrosomonadales bacterium]